MTKENGVKELTDMVADFVAHRNSDCMVGYRSGQ